MFSRSLFLIFVFDFTDIIIRDDDNHVGVGSLMLSSAVNFVSSLVLPKRGGVQCQGSCGRKVYKKDVDASGICADCRQQSN